MGNPSAALSGQPQPGGTDIDAILAAGNRNVSTLLGREQKLATKEAADTDAIDQQTDKRDQESDRTMAGVKIPTLDSQALKPFSPPAPTDPKQIWASAAMVLAGLGSLFTRQPLTTAMNAAAGVINAVHKGDQEAANSAFAQWKAAQDTALKVANFEQDTYRDLIDQMKDLRDANDRQAQEKKRDLLAQYTAQANALQDQVAAQTKSTDDAIHLYQARSTNINRMTAQGPKIEEELQLDQAWKEMQGTPQYQSADPIARAKMYRDLLHQVAPELAVDHDPFTNPTSRAKLVKVFTDSVPGKANAVAQDANETIQSLAKQPDITTNPAEQLTLIDKFVFLATGSIRPTIAQYQKILGAKTAQDYLDTIAGRIAHHPILGRDQINNMVSGAQVDADSARKAYDSFIMQPQNRELAKELGMLPDGATGQGQDAYPNAPPVGTIEKGFRYQGGDPQSQDSWAPVGGT